MAYNLFLEYSETMANNYSIGSHFVQVLPGTRSWLLLSDLAASPWSPRTEALENAAQFEEKVNG